MDTPHTVIWSVPLFPGKEFSNVNNKKTTESGPDKTPDEIHKARLAEIEEMWRSKEINFGRFRFLVAGADRRYAMSKKAEPDEPKLPTKKQIGRWVERGFCSEGDAARLMDVVRQIDQTQPDYPERLIRSFLEIAEVEGIITEEKQNAMIEFLLESYEGDFI